MSDAVRIEPSPDHPGWLTYEWASDRGFNQQVLGPTLIRRDSDTTSRVRIVPGPHLANYNGSVHGGALMGLIDMSLFGGLAAIAGRFLADAQTLDVATQFIAPGQIGQPLDAVVELLRETGRMAFLSGVVEQDGTLIAAFQGKIRKPSPRA